MKGKREKYFGLNTCIFKEEKSTMRVRVMSVKLTLKREIINYEWYIVR